MQIKKNFRKSILRCLMVFLAVAVTVTMTPVGMDEAYGETTLATETPEILVSGTAVIGGESYDASNVYCEKAYTRKELIGLKEYGGDENVLYSQIKAKIPEGSSEYPKQLTRATGVYADTLLSRTFMKETNYKDIVSFIASDGWKVTFDPDFEYSEKTNGKTTTLGLMEPRFVYKELLNSDLSDDEKKNEANVDNVNVMIAWALQTSQEKDPGTAGDEKDTCTLVVGQLGLDNRNNPLYNKNLQKIIGGKELTKAELTVDGKEYTRGDILLMDRATRAYGSDNVRGVPLEVLLNGYDNSTKVKFKTADGKEEVITMGDLVKGNSVLAYEENAIVELSNDDVATNNDIFIGIYDSDNSGNYGLFRLYSDNREQPLEMVNAIEIVKEDSGAATDNPPAVDNTEDNASDNNDKTAETADKPDTSAKTGDEMPIGLLAGVLAAAAAGIFGTLCIRRKAN